MRLPSVILVLVATAPPAAADDACKVRVVRAPDQVRAAIEARVGLESSCVSLDVRVIPTREGYYVIATPPSGDVFEGNVRDPGLVGELVTGWARLPGTVPPETVEPPAPPPKPTVAELPPSAAPVVDVAEKSPAPARTRDRDLAVGAIATSNSFGARAEVDVIAHAGFSLGLAVGISSSEWSYPNEGMEPSVDLAFRDMRALITAAKTWSGGPWRLRTQLAFGVMHTQYSGVLDVNELGVTMNVEGEGVTNTFELAVTAAREIAPSWAISIGPLLTYYGQEYDLDSTFVKTGPTREYDVGGYLAIKRRL
jgi:hypothetical protein